jgi:hypothetical protein
MLAQNLPRKPAVSRVRRAGARATERLLAMDTLFASFFQAGFECSCQRHWPERRLDLIAATRHDRFVAADYARLRSVDIRTARDGVRWPLVARTGGQYDFASLLPMLRAARAAGLQVIWDLCHYGWPDDLDIFRPAFVRAFARYARATAQVIAAESDGVPFLSPINEISFWAWAGGDVAYFNPHARGRGLELKAQLVRAAIEAIDAIWSVVPGARIVHADPIIRIAPLTARRADRLAAAGHHAAQYQGWDMLAGMQWPQLGGDPKYLDIIGVNFYPHNQWFFDGPTIRRGHPIYRPFRQMLNAVYQRYHRPLFVAETGAEDEARPEWLRYVSREVRAAMAGGVPVAGICLYPILNHPGWDDERHCHNGLWDAADEHGERDIYEPLARELRRQQRLMRLVASSPGMAAPLAMALAEAAS